MKSFHYVTQSMKKENEQGGRCGSRAAGPEGIAGRCIDFDKRVPVGPGVGWLVQQVQKCCHRA